MCTRTHTCMRVSATRLKTLDYKQCPASFSCCQHTQPNFVLFLLLGNKQMTTGRNERGAIAIRNISFTGKPLVTYKKFKQELLICYSVLITWLSCSFLLIFGQFEKTAALVEIYAFGQIWGKKEKSNALMGNVNHLSLAGSG